MSINSVRRDRQRGSNPLFGLSPARGGSGTPEPSSILSLNPAAWYRFNIGITVVGSGVDTWADQSGNGRDLRQTTDTNRPALQGDGSITFDGVDNYLGVAFTLPQPATFYLLFKMISWTGNDYILDGAGTTTLGFQNKNTGASPQLAINAGSQACTNSDLAVGVRGAAAIVLNGASSSIKINANAAVTGNAGAAAPNGLTLGATGGALTFANITAYELIAFTTAQDAATQTLVNAYLNSL